MTGGTQMAEYTIVLTWDDEAQVWVAENDDIPIALNSASLDELIERVRLAVPEMLELNGKQSEGIPLHFKAERIVAAA
jgi:predicted RNase H-like HicB family nuclease